MFSAFLGPENHLKICECPVALSSVISEDKLTSQSQGCYILLRLTENKSHN